ncbi:hypothetical protein NKJ40_21300 [Mesorhizobium sp. M0119]|uniref:hypothetical protein n=1 Tax=Mesorhizobium sp. M0119 TaxID=2956885 RepID=UPI00333937BE
MEKKLAKSLSRHIGYTAAAYDLDRTVSILDYFTATPSAYLTEVVSHLHLTANDVSGDLEDKYLAEAVNIASSLQIISVVSPRASKIHKVAPTMIGRSLLGAKASGDLRFYKYFLLKVILLADSDTIAIILEYLHSGTRGDIKAYYLSSFSRLRQARLRWLERAFPERQLLDRMVSHIPWIRKDKSAIGRYDIEPITLNTARHHVTPRRGWLDYLGLADHTSGQLTSFGKAVHSALSPSGSYFWLGPEREVQTLLRIDPANRAAGPFEDELKIVPSITPRKSTSRMEIVRDTARLMVAAYTSAKLVHASQAPLDLPIAYIEYRSYRDGVNYEWPGIMDDLFKMYKGNFQRLSAKVGQIGYYKVVNQRLGDIRWTQDLG